MAEVLAHLRRAALPSFLLIGLGLYASTRPPYPAASTVNGVYFNLCCGSVTLRDGVIENGAWRVPFDLALMKFGLTAYPKQEVLVRDGRVEAHPDDDPGPLLFNEDGTVLSICGDTTCNQVIAFKRHAMSAHPIRRQLTVSERDFRRSSPPTGDIQAHGPANVRFPPVTDIRPFGAPNERQANDWSRGLCRLGRLLAVSLYDRADARFRHGSARVIAVSASASARRTAFGGARPVLALLPEATALRSAFDPLRAFSTSCMSLPW